MKHRFNIKVLHRPLNQIIISKILQLFTHYRFVRISHFFIMNEATSKSSIYIENNFFFRAENNFLFNLKSAYHLLKFID